MEKQILEIISVSSVTHDVIQILTHRPQGIDFLPGQAGSISINKPGWAKEERSFTFTSLSVSENLEFIIKTYPAHNGVTGQLLLLMPHDELVLHEVFGAISYLGEGVFIAGGAGITPFIAIIRDLNAKNAIGGNQLIFANKTKADIILEEEFHDLLGEAFVNVLSDEVLVGYQHGMITAALLKSTVPDLNRHFYVCGPPPMIEAVENQLIGLGVKKELIVKEEV